MRALSREQLAGVALVNVATFMWASNVVLGRLLKDTLGPLTLSAARFVIAAICFLVLLRKQPAEERRPGKDIWPLLGMAATGVVLFSPTLYAGVRFTTAASATLISGLGPLITGILGALMLGESMTRSQILGATAGILGAVILVAAGSAGLADGVNARIGDILVFVAVVIWSVYSVLSRAATKGRSTISATALSTFFGLPFLLVASGLELRTASVEPSVGLLLAILFIGLGPCVVGYLSWNEGVRRLGASGAMAFYLTLPVYGTLLGYLVLGESLGSAHIVGGLLIVGGGVLGVVDL